MTKVLTLAVVVAVSLIGMAGNAQAADQIHRSFDLPATLSATLEATACSGAPGPQVSLQGDLVLSGMNVEVLFRDTGPQVSQEPIVIEQVVVPTDEHVSTPAQSIVGGLGDNPFIWLQILDAKGKPLTSELFLGRCDQGTFTPTANFFMPATAIADVTATECGTAPGPSIQMDGAAEIASLTGRLIFRNSIPVGNPKGKIDQTVSEVVIQPAGLSHPFPTQPVLANSGTNPLVSVRFRLQDGSVAGPEVRLGRCTSLSIQ